MCIGKVWTTLQSTHTHSWPKKFRREKEKNKLSLIEIIFDKIIICGYLELIELLLETQVKSMNYKWWLQMLITLSQNANDVTKEKSLTVQNENTKKINKVLIYLVTKVKS